ncbi:MAG: alpha/beta hydrolase [Chloroflexota bacterium]|nr:alpha/beta hydrolase [Chloroflexota bacterium]
MTRPAAFDADGPADAPAIVFLHGTRLTRSLWKRQMADLRDAYRVVALDLPGHGALADEGFTLERARMRVIDSIDAEAGGRAVVVGLSLGGYVAMDVAAASPGRVRGLVLSGATAEPRGPMSAPFRTFAWALDRFDGPRLDSLNRWSFRARFPPTIAQPIIDGGFWSAGGADAVRALIGERFTRRLAAYPGPTLILNGEYDLPFRLFAPSFARAARRPSRVRIAGASHLANLDRPAAFDLAIRRFVEGLSDPDRPAEMDPVID